jgi:hypothetical protein
MEAARRFWKTLGIQARERGWLLALITGACILVGVVCIVVGGFVAYRALVDQKVPIQQPAAMFAAGMLMLVATHSMWTYERWGRNVAVAVTFCMAWVMAEALCRRYGLGVGAKTPVVVFGALSLSYFTSTKGRHLFRKKDKDDDDDKPAGDDSEKVNGRQNEVVG